MKVSFERDGSVLIARPHGRIEGLAAATALQRAIEAALRPADAALILDFESLAYISSAGLRAVAILRNRTRATRMNFALCSLSKPVQDLFATSGFDNLVRVVDTLDNARRAVTERF